MIARIMSFYKPGVTSVLKMKPRNLFAMPETENTPNTTDDTGEVDMVVTGVEHMNISNQIHDLVNWSRNDVQDATVDA